MCFCSGSFCLSFKLLITLFDLEKADKVVQSLDKNVETLVQAYSQMKVMAQTWYPQCSLAWLKPPVPISQIPSLPGLHGDCLMYDWEYKAGHPKHQDCVSQDSVIYWIVTAM